MGQRGPRAVRPARQPRWVEPIREHMQYVYPTPDISWHWSDQEIERERCSFSDVGTVISKDDRGATRLIVTDRESAENPIPIDLPMDALFPLGQRPERRADTVKRTLKPFDAVASLEAMYGKLGSADLIARATELVFQLPSVGSKMFLITIGDRSVGGLTARDQLVGPWQTPVADVAVTLTSFNLDEKIRRGEAMAMGEKPTLVCDTNSKAWAALTFHLPHPSLLPFRIATY